MTVTEQTLAERAGLYSLLHAFYTYPLTESLLADVAGLSLPAESPLFDGLVQMQTGQLSAETLNVEMTRLLEGPGRTPAPPYASYYLNDRQLMGPPATMARQTYLEWQIYPEGDQYIPDDHLALELGFMAYLAQLALSSEPDRNKALVASYRFLVDQIVPWLPHFSRALTQATEEPFFVGLVRFTQAAIQSDLEWLESYLRADPRQAPSVQTPGV